MHINCIFAYWGAWSENILYNQYGGAFLTLDVTVIMGVYGGPIVLAFQQRGKKDVHGLPLYIWLNVMSSVMPT